MPFVKLWNAVFGSSQPTKSSKPAGSKKSRRSEGPTRKLAKPTTPIKPESAAPPQQPAQIVIEPAHKATPAASRPAASKRSVFDFVSGGPHASLCKMIKKSGAKSVLEVGLGDGSRATAVLSTLAKSRPATDIKYIAIDLFEMGNAELTLKEFHQKIRTIDVKPNLIPMPCQQGLRRVAHTFGAIDVVLLATAEVDICDPLIARVTHASSLILHWDGQVWKQIPTTNSGQTGRTAA